MKYLKAINAIYFFIIGVGVPIFVFTGRILEHGPDVALGSVLGMILFCPPFILAYFALRNRHARTIQWAFGCNAFLVATFVVASVVLLVFYSHEGVYVGAALLGHWLFIGIPALLNAAAMKKLAKPSAAMAKEDLR